MNQSDSCFIKKTNPLRKLCASASLRLIFLLFVGFPTLTAMAQDCDSVPPLNKEILSFAQSKLDTKVGRGQCWDLAAAALQSINAKWDGAYKFGRVVNPKKECVYAGDIIQFEKVKVEYEKEGVFYQEDFSHHTAIVHKVNAAGSYELIHQNIGNGSKKVGITSLDLKNIKRGKYTVFRPTH